MKIITLLFSFFFVTHCIHGMNYNYTLPNDSTRTEREYERKMVQFQQEKTAIENRMSANQATPQDETRYRQVTINLSTYQDKLKQCLDARKK